MCCNAPSQGVILVLLLCCCCRQPPLLPHAPIQTMKALLHVLSWQGVYLAPNFVSPSELTTLRTIGQNIRNVQPSTDQNRGNLTQAFFVDEYFGTNAGTMTSPPFLLELEARITNVTGIPSHRDETSLLFTSQTPQPNAPSSVGYLHHDKNGRARRSVTMLLYLTTTTNDTHGGHTLFPALSRHLIDPLASMAPNSENSGDSGHSAAYQLPKGWRQPTSTVRNIAQRLSRGYHQGHLTLTDGSYGNERVMWDRTAFKLVQNECTLARTGKNHALAITPKAGDAVFFWSSYPDGRTNPLMFHTACVAVGGAAREAMQKFKEPKWGNDASDLRRASHGAGTEEDTQAFEFEVR